MPQVKLQSVLPQKVEKILSDYDEDLRTHKFRKLGGMYDPYDRLKKVLPGSTPRLRNLLIMKRQKKVNH